MRGRHAVAAFVVTSAAGLLVIVAVGLTDRRAQVFSLRAPTQQSAAILVPGAEACEGPITGSTGPVQGIRTWGAAIGHSTRLDIIAKSPAGQLLSAGSVVASVTANGYSAMLSTAIAQDRAITVCVINSGGADFSLLGSPSVDPAIPMRLRGVPSPLQFSLALLGPASSNLSQLPLAFSRAAVFRPSWVGTWTFWLLLAGILVAAVAAGAAIVAAAQADARGGR